MMMMISNKSMLERQPRKKFSRLKRRRKNNQTIVHLSYPQQCSALRKNGYVMLKGRPCKIMEMSTSKTGKHGHAKVRPLLPILLLSSRTSFRLTWLVSIYLQVNDTKICVHQHTIWTYPMLDGWNTR